MATILYSICLSAYRPMSMVPTRNPNLMVVATAAHSSFEAVGKTSGPNYQIVTMANQFSIRISRDPPMSRHIAPPLAVPARATAGFAPVHLGRSQVSDSWRLSLCLLRPCGLYRFYLSSTRNIIGTDRKFSTSISYMAIDYTLYSHFCWINWGSFGTRSKQLEFNNVISPLLGTFTHLHGHDLRVVLSAEPWNKKQKK